MIRVPDPIELAVSAVLKDKRALMAYGKLAAACGLVATSTEILTGVCLDVAQSYEAGDADVLSAASEQGKVFWSGQQDVDGRKGANRHLTDPFEAMKKAAAKDKNIMAAVGGVMVRCGLLQVPRDVLTGLLLDRAQLVAKHDPKKIEVWRKAGERFRGQQEAKKSTGQSKPSGGKSKPSSDKTDTGHGKASGDAKTPERPEAQKPANQNTGAGEGSEQTEFVAEG